MSDQHSEESFKGNDDSASNDNAAHKGATIVVHGEAVGNDDSRSDSADKKAEAKDSRAEELQKSQRDEIVVKKLELQGRLPALPDDGYIGVQKQQVVTRDGKPDIAFTGTLLASAAPEAALDGEWQEYRVYETDGGKYVFSKVTLNAAPDQDDTHEAEVFEPTPSTMTSRVLRGARDLLHSEPMDWTDAAVSFFWLRPACQDALPKIGSAVRRTHQLTYRAKRAWLSTGILLSFTMCELGTAAPSTAASQWVMLDPDFHRQADRHSIDRQGPWVQFTQAWGEIKEGKPGADAIVETMAVNCLTGAYGATQYPSTDQQTHERRVNKQTFSEIEHHEDFDARLVLGSNSTELGRALIGFACTCEVNTPAQTPTVSELQSAYDRYIAEPLSKQEFRLSFLRLKSKQMAQNAIAELDAGKPFATVFDEHASSFDAKTFPHGDLGPHLETEFPIDEVRRYRQLDIGQYSRVPSDGMFGWESISSRQNAPSLHRLSLSCSHAYAIIWFERTAADGQPRRERPPCRINLAPTAANLELRFPPMALSSRHLKPRHRAQAISMNTESINRDATAESAISSSLGIVDRQLSYKRMAMGYLYLNAFLYLVFAIWCTAATSSTAFDLGYLSLSDGGRSEYLVIYGGLQLGLAIVFYLLARSLATARLGVMIALAIYAPIVIYRAVTVFGNWPVAGVTLGTACLELAMLIAAAWLYVGLRVVRA